MKAAFGSEKSEKSKDRESEKDGETPQAVGRATKKSVIEKVVNLESIQKIIRMRWTILAKYILSSDETGEFKINYFFFEFNLLTI